MNKSCGLDFTTWKKTININLKIFKNLLKIKIKNRFHLKIRNKEPSFSFIYTYMQSICLILLLINNNKDYKKWWTIIPSKSRPFQFIFSILTTVTPNITLQGFFQFIFTMLTTVTPTITLQGSFQFIFSMLTLFDTLYPKFINFF